MRVPFRVPAQDGALARSCRARSARGPAAGPTVVTGPSVKSSGKCVSRRQAARSHWPAIGSKAMPARGSICATSRAPPCEDDAVEAGLELEMVADRRRDVGIDPPAVQRHVLRRSAAEQRSRPRSTDVRDRPLRPILQRGRADAEKWLDARQPDLLVLGRGARSSPAQPVLRQPVAAIIRRRRPPSSDVAVTDDVPPADATEHEKELRSSFGKARCREPGQGRLGAADGREERHMVVGRRVGADEEGARDQRCRSSLARSPVVSMPARLR